MEKKKQRKVGQEAIWPLFCFRLVLKPIIWTKMGKEEEEIGNARVFLTTTTTK